MSRPGVVLFLVFGFFCFFWFFFFDEMIFDARSCSIAVFLWMQGAAIVLFIFFVCFVCFVFLDFDFAIVFNVFVLFCFFGFFWFFYFRALIESRRRLGGFQFAMSDLRSMTDTYGLSWFVYKNTYIISRFLGLFLFCFGGGRFGQKTGDSDLRM
jgi:hypothetical protein